MRRKRVKMTEKRIEKRTCKTVKQSRRFDESQPLSLMMGLRQMYDVLKEYKNVNRKKRSLAT